MSALESMGGPDQFRTKLSERPALETERVEETVTQKFSGKLSPEAASLYAKMSAFDLPIDKIDEFVQEFNALGTAQFIDSAFENPDSTPMALAEVEIPAQTITLANGHRFLLARDMRGVSKLTNPVTNPVAKQ